MNDTTSISASPSISNGVVTVGARDGFIYGINLADGSLRWAFTTGGDVRASVAVGNGMIYAGSFDGQLYAVLLDGTLAWTFRSGDRIVDPRLDVFRDFINSLGTDPESESRGPG